MEMKNERNEKRQFAFIPLICFDLISITFFVYGKKKKSTSATAVGMFKEDLVMGSLISSSFGEKNTNKFEQI